MTISELDLLHHRMIIGDIQAKEQLKNILEEGGKNKCPVVQDFLNNVKRYKDNTASLKPSFIQKHRNKIIDCLEKPYKITKYFMFCSVAVFFAVSFYYA